MTDYSTKQQRMKRQIFNFVKKVSGGLKRPEQKFLPIFVTVCLLPEAVF